VATRTAAEARAGELPGLAAPPAAAYVADAELYVVQVAHATYVQSLGLHRTSDSGSMPGRLVNLQGYAVDVCAPYAAAGVPCAAGLGRVGLPDALPLASLLEAAGVASLDAPGDRSRLVGRDGGLVLVSARAPRPPPPPTHTHTHSRSSPPRCNSTRALSLPLAHRWSILCMTML
jgi:hypothetical protein